jgi:hypothetical protein
VGSLPPAEAGVGSAVNETARELGSTLGVAIVGSVFSSIYASRLGHALAGSPVPPQAIDVAKSSVGGAEVVAHQAGVQAGAQAESLVHSAVDQSFVDGWHAGSWVCFGVVLVGALVAWRWLPSAQSGQDPTGRTLSDPVASEGREPPAV